MCGWCSGLILLSVSVTITRQNFKARDGSLFTEHFMSMKVEAKGQTLYTVPKSQSDTFWRNAWTKETDVLTRESYEQIFREINEINEKPIIVQTGSVTLHVMSDAIYSMIDGNVANAIVGNRNSHGSYALLSLESKNGPVHHFFTVN